jgi:hypothetical protein
MFALCGNRTRDLFRSKSVFPPLRQIGRPYKNLYSIEGAKSRPYLPILCLVVLPSHVRASCLCVAYAGDTEGSYSLLPMHRVSCVVCTGDMVQ